ncbi:HNH endonuclease [Maricaulis sp.]|uniref:HNH endonuclease n=1 Tax=Maricaulis sp. TaxID=1486257 RepID=UPI002B27A8EF|nr:HNH endonuclease [Maricaulis sp.]
MIKLLNNYPGLLKVQERLKAPDISWRPELDDLAEREAVRFEAVEVDGVALEDVADGPGGLFQLEGQQVVIYIKDHTRRIEVREDPARGNRVHLKACSTIEEMRRRKRFDRYVATSRRDNLYRIDVFEYDEVTLSEIEAPIHVCLNCLKELNYKGAAEGRRSARRRIQSEFDVTEFLESYSTFFGGAPRYTDKTAPRSIYVDDWSKISERVRYQAGWTCSKCDVSLHALAHHRWLHVHHKNGHKGDNRPSNLEPLCALCHADEPGHERMHVDPRAKRSIERLRREQTGTS